MMRSVAFVALGTTNGVSITPVQKVTQMLYEMEAKGKAAMAQEAKIAATYTEWVSDETTRLNQNIETANMDIEKLSAFITKTDNDVAVLGDEIGQLDGLTAQKEGELGDATTLREKENTDYVARQQDLSDSVDALTGAIQTLKSQAYSRPQAMMLLQQRAVSTPGMRAVLAAFLQQQNQEPGAPDVAAYEFQSGGIIQVLEGLLVKFQKELSDCEEDESNSNHNYELNKLQLTDILAYTNRNRNDKAASKGDLTAQSSKAKGDLAATKAAKAADEETLADMKAVHGQKMNVYNANQAVRSSELEALAKAIEILGQPNVVASYSNHINLVQKPSFLQTRSTSERVMAKQRVATFLRKRSQALASKNLAALAEEIQENPFTKVIDMIRTLLARLKEEANSEADHKSWCDAELKNNKIKRDKKTAQSEKLQAEIEGMNAEIASKGKKIATLSKEQADLSAAMAQSTSDRNTEKATNLATIKDAQEGAAAVRSAMAILRDWYAAQASFVQQVPEMAAYNGMQSRNKGVVGVLEVIVSDFVRLEAETKANEVQAARAYKLFMDDATRDKKAKHKLEFKTRLDKDEEEFKVSNAEKQLAGVDQELSMANAYFAQLTPECVEIHVSYESRVANRKEEIQALKDAYSILDKKGAI